MAKGFLAIGAIILAAIAVVGILVWMTGSWPNQETPDETTIAVDIIPSSTPATGTPRITPDAAISEVQPMPDDVAGVTASAQTGPAENILLGAAVLTLLGFSSSMLLAKFA